MDLDRMTPSARLTLCRKYFYFGLACLPFLWLVNTIWFGHFVFIKKGQTAKDRARRKSPGGSSVVSPNSDQAGTSAAEPLRTEPSTSGSSRQRHRSRPTNDREQSQQRETPFDADLEEEKRRSLEGIRRFVILSAIGTFIWAALIITWVTIYQVNRASWGEFGDRISFNIPRGIP